MRDECGDVLGPGQVEPEWLDLEALGPQPAGGLGPPERSRGRSRTTL